MTKFPPKGMPEDDPECTDCGGTGITFQTHRRCACQPLPTQEYAVLWPAERCDCGDCLECDARARRADIRAEEAARREIGPARWIAENRALKARIDDLEAENARLSQAVGSGMLGDLLTPDETAALVEFIKSLRPSA